MKFGLTSDTIESLQKVFATNKDVEKVIIYGSRAKGNYKPGSDIDLTLIAPGLQLSDLLRLEVELDELLLPFKIDLSLHHQIENKDLLEHIERVGVVFYDRENQPI